ncbi:putative secondary metabolism biosynthetic enzyme [Pestalotiopsis sp. IQ-011]
MAMTEQGVLSPGGSCKTFSADADGYARGEAITALYVKPLAEAIRDGNPVRAVIRGTAHNFDGKTTGFSTPSADAQEAVIRRAYETAGIADINATAMMECHGTGTVNGDLIETEAVARVFGSQGIYIGSVKPNLGHSEGASGLVSIVKAVLALEHHTIPPNIGFTAPNPNIPFASAGLKVPLEPTAWPPNRADRVSISAFGIGGVNAHAILDSAVSSGVAPVRPARFVNRAQLLLFSAKSSQSLARMPVRFTEWVDKNPNQVENLAYTLALRREHLPHRCFALIDKNGTVGTVSAPIKPLAASQESPKVVMVFTGQGAQWPLMGRELLQSNAAFRASIQSLDQHLQTIKGENAPDYSIEDELLKPARKSRVNTASLSQPLCTAIQIALVDTLKSLGITPAAAVGHSSGEIAGAYAAGALTYGEAIVIAHLRGKMVSTQKRAGSMAAVGMSWAATEKFLIPGVVIACDNSPTSVTISGDSEAVEAVMKGIRAVHPSALVRLLQVDKAYHSHHMSDVGDAYLDALLQHGVTGQTHTTTPIFSSVVGGVWQQPAALGAKYWRDNLESPVRFREAVISISGHDVGKHALFLEIGPHSALAGPLRQILSSVSSPAQYASAMVRNRDCLEGFLGTVGKIWSLHIPVRFETLLTGDKCLPDLPRYPWNHEGGTYWNESRLSKEWRQRRFARHELLGIRVPESSDIEPAWRNVFHLQDVPWVNDHKFGGDVVFPFAAYIAIAGEAVKQVSGVSEGFSIRNIIVSAALVFSDSKSSEILTTFKPCRITDSLKSQWWWEFTVASYNNQTWTQHCTGEVRPIALKTAGSVVDMKTTFPRRLVAQEWYDVIHRTGLELGPSFQTLHSLESSVDSSHQAMARVRAVAEPTESDYHIHPTIVDGALQSMYCAAVSGLARKVKAWLPFSIEQLEVTRCPSPISSDMMVETTAQTTSNLSLAGNTRCTSSQTVVFEASGIRMRLADDRTPQNADAAARYTWAPDASFVCIKDLVRPMAGRGSGTVLLEETAMDCVLSSVSQLQQVQPPSENLQRYASWIRTIASEQQKLSSNAESEIQVPAPDTHAQTGHDFANMPDVSAVAAAEHIRDSLVQIASGESLDKFVPHETMYSLANFIMHQVDPNPLIQCLAHTNPMLRVLEIVDERFPLLAGTAVNDLILPGSQAVRYSKYTVSVKGYMSDKDREEKSGKVDYVSLDISRDLADQNFEAHQYDLVIASGIAQAGDRSCLQRSLANIKRILVPGGRLLLQEINPTSIWANFVFGSQYGWWRSISPVSRSPRDVHTRDNSDDLPRRLEFELSEADLGDVEVITSDSLSTTVVIKSTDSCSRPAQGTVTVLCLDHEGGAVDGSAVEKSVICQLRTTGYEVTRCVLGDEVPLNHDVVCLLDANGPFFDNPSPNNFEALKQLLTRLSTGCGGAAIFWPTLACQMGCRNPSYAPIIGFARTIRSEMLLDFATCEVDSFEGEVSSLIDVFGKFRDRRQRSSHSENGGSQNGPNLRPDFEYVVRDGKVNVGRFYPFALRDELMTSGPVKRAGVDTATPGRINSLRWEERPVDTMGSGDVEVEVYSAGLNFRDILVALGIVELPVRHFGVEGAGVITRIGSDVKAMNVGDRVLFLHRGCFVTSAIVPEHACARIPDKLSFDEAATMTFAFATAIYSLVNAGGLEKGQSVLIHSACGGVGLAAIQIAQMYGAQIYATVSSDEKVQFLMKNFAIPRSSILHSRDESFAPDIMRQTGGKGVDLVLNSLSGELLHATWSCVAPFGKMIEIGKRDLLGRGKLDMRPFLENRSYSCVDMDLLWTRPEVFKRCVRYIVELYEQGRIGPIRPFKIFSADSIQEAFRYMHQGQHIGRIGLAIRDPQGTSKVGTEVARKRRDVRFDMNASYVLIGGMGGIGRAVSRWMVEHGAGELIFLSRSAGTGPEDGAFAHELKSAGCRGVRLVPGDVTKSEDVARAVAAATLPLKGVIQLSMVLRDGAFENMTLDAWNAAAAPKIQGTWNIHNATLGLDLDFFVLFSSLSGAMGNHHQANYASANTFLDAFVQYRTGLGLAASAIGVGAVGDIGYISSNPQLLHRMKATGWEFTTEQQVLDAVTVAIAAPRRQNHGTEFVEMNAFVMGLGPTTQLNSPGNRAIWRDDRRMAVYHNATSMAAVAESGAAKGPAEAIRAFLRSSLADSSILTTGEAARFLGAEIGKQLSGLLLKSDQEEPNLSQPLIDLGLDSLVAIELRAWWKETLGFNISTLELLRASSLYALGQRAVAGLTVS